MTSPKATPSSLLARIPSVDEILRSGLMAGTLATFPRTQVADAVRAALADLRKKLLSGAKPADANPEALTAAVRNRLESERRKGLRNVVNATGIILHTGLGRAVLADDEVEKLPLRVRQRVLQVDFNTAGVEQLGELRSRLIIACRQTSRSREKQPREHLLCGRQSIDSVEVVRYLAAEDRQHDLTELFLIKFVR